MFESLNPFNSSFVQETTRRVGGEVAIHFNFDFLHVFFSGWNGKKGSVNLNGRLLCAYFMSELIS